MSDWMDELKAMKERLYEKEGITAHIGDVNSILKKYDWHPASEPPEETVEVIVDTQEMENDNDKYTNIYIAVLHDGYWLLRTKSDDCVVSAKGTYWMPLPEPYQPKGE
jgi:hypothetical protein